MKDQIPLVAVVGPTASGKTVLGIKLAHHFDGEIVSADSMQIYKGMDIATAKPTEGEKEGIPHHLIDFLDPSESFSVADYVKLARRVIEDIHSRGKLPILVGGTGLYVNSLIDNIEFQPEPENLKVREELAKQAEQLGNETMLEILRSIDPETASRVHPNNIRRIIRALEVYKTTGITMSEYQRLSRQKPSPYNVCMIGIGFRDRKVLYDRINRRVDLMVENGLIEEAKKVLDSPISTVAGQAIGYKELKPYLMGEIPLSEAIENLKRETRRYAKRQLTWFRRDKRINWIYADQTQDLTRCAIDIITKAYSS
ncbi:MAG TPA: tRNA (adenosine(37)-N6)-dimethylallyltransferase MiaA [Clostridiales bacterium]|nr:tRNA (adenosine(37)-N6)-dimethylallyltransferase MiaA [Clostridiales bacterium]